jgi:hypothetical protein
MSLPRIHRSIPTPRQPATAAGTDLVVVAVDGSPASVRALGWALRHAHENDLRIEVLTTWPLHGPVFVREVSGHFCQPRWDAREAQAAAAARALATIDHAPAYDLRVENASLVDALVRAAERCVLVVMGSDRPTGAHADPDRLPERVRHAVSGEIAVVGTDGQVARTATPSRKPAR